MKLRIVGLILMVGFPVAARADIEVQWANGSDGDLNVTANLVRDLSEAETISLAEFEAGMNPSPGKGVYIPEKRAVVFRYSSVNINASRTLTFKNHPSRAPVVWLVSGDVTISGLLSVNATQMGGADGQFGEPGPGGFRGGRGNHGLGQLQSGGLGPGGTRNLANGQGPYGGSHATPGSSGSGVSSAGPTYGNASITQLLGGSGGSGALYLPTGSSAIGGCGGGGGGAILIACQGILRINSSGGIEANGVGGGDSSSSGGSGGAIKLIADQIIGSGRLRAVGGPSSFFGAGAGGAGRIRLESTSTAVSDYVPDASFGVPAQPVIVWPPAETPIVEIISIGSAVVPADPHASLDYPNYDVPLAEAGEVVVQIKCKNIPLPPVAWTLDVRVIPKMGQDFTVEAEYVSGNFEESTWEARITFADGFSVVQAHGRQPS
ncbi:MAG: hypothetical protein KF841_02205 [Phycisphaerae bacterium]|nr:hypothetical protein [Phycisphaerae bacterium]